MTVIEFFDRESEIENIVSTLLCAPDKVVFIGESKKIMLRSIEKYKPIAARRGIKVEFEAVSVNRNSTESIVAAIEAVISDNGECVVDLSGGDDLCLVATGIVYGKNKSSVGLHRFNIANGTMTDCDSDGVLCSHAPMKITIEEAVEINGGRIDGASRLEGIGKDISESFVKELSELWKVCRENPSEWNFYTNIIAAQKNENSEGLFIRLDYDKAKKSHGIDRNVFRSLSKTLSRLASRGLLKDFRADEFTISFEFSSKRILRCLTKAGQVLELVVAVSALMAQSNGERVYNDVMTGVCIDWNREPHGPPDIENEVDVILMRGMIPVFISCKNGNLSADELYKLFVVAERFGGKYVRKALVATELEKMGYKEDYIKARAENLGIKIIDNIDEFDLEDIGGVIADI